MEYLLLIGGLAVLVFSGELLVRGASGIALKANIPPLIVGLTVVSLGTSAPELFASVKAAFADPGLAIGNVIGSNVANISLVLGITALIFPIPVAKNILKIDWPIMIVVTAIFVLMAMNMEFSQIDGILLLACLVSFILFMIYRAKKEKVTETEADEFTEFKSKGYLMLIGLVAAGCVGLYFGSEWFINGAIEIATSFGVSGAIIGATVVAFGTSVPELVASTVAAFRKQTDISIGNLIGSNIFNVLAVLGVASTVCPLAVPGEVMDTQVWWMVGIALLILPLMLIGRKLGRWQGAILLAFYIIYTYFVIQG